MDSYVKPGLFRLGHGRIQPAARSTPNPEFFFEGKQEGVTKPRSWRLKTCEQYWLVPGRFRAPPKSGGCMAAGASASPRCPDLWMTLNWMHA